MKKSLYWMPALFIGGLIFYLSTEPVSTIPTFSYSDKLYHFLAYAALSFSTIFAFIHSLNKLLKYLVIAAILFCTLYGLGLEVLQSFIPTREMSGLDELSNTLGSIFGVWFYIRLRKMSFLRKQESRTC